LSETFFLIGFVSFCILNYVLSQSLIQSNPNLSGTKNEEAGKEE
jgi:hypothetical protein